MSHSDDCFGNGDGEVGGKDVGYDDIGDDSATMTLIIMVTTGLAVTPATP